MNFIIKRFIIENFQSHVKTIIELAPAGQLTVVNGPSRSGKSSILRAIRWLFYNSPRGVSVPDPKERMDPTEPSYCRSGATFIRVTAEYEDGHKVIRERTRSANKYIISIPGEVKPQELAGFGDNVPLEVQQATGIRPLQIGDVELFLNLSEQLDGPFLGSKAVSAPARAKVLGKLAGTEEIDFAGKTLGTDLYRRGQDEKRLTGEVAGLEEDIKIFGYLPAMARKIEQLEVLAERVKVGQALKNKWTGLKTSLENIDEKIAATQVVLFRWRNLDAAESYLLAAQEKGRLNVTLGTLITQMEGIAGNIYYARLIIAKWSGLPEAERLLPIIASNQARKETLAALVKRYQMDASNIKACQEIIERRSGLTDAEATLKAAQATVEKARRLRNIRTSYFAGSEMIKRSQDVLTMLKGVEDAGAIAIGVGESLARRDALARRRGSYIDVIFKVSHAEKSLSKLAGVEGAGVTLQQTEEKQKRWKQLKALKDKYTLRLDAIEAARLIAIERENRVAELEGAYYDELDSLGVCPMCGALKNEMRIREVV